MTIKARIADDETLDLTLHVSDKERAILQAEADRRGCTLAELSAMLLNRNAHRKPADRSESHYHDFLEAAFFERDRQ